MESSKGSANRVQTSIVNSPLSPNFLQDLEGVGVDQPFTPVRSAASPTMLARTVIPATTTYDSAKFNALAYDLDHKPEDVLDNITAKHTVPAKVKMDGVLYKVSDWTRSWNKRYATLDGNILSFAKSEKSKPHSSIDLSSGRCFCSWVRFQGGRVNGIELVVDDKVYLFSTDTASEKNQWIEAINAAIYASVHDQ